MPQERFEFRISFRKLLIGAAVTIVPISLITLYEIGRSGRHVQETIGRQFATNAQASADEVAQFIRAHVVETALMASDTAVIEGVTAANRAYAGLNESQIKTRIDQREASWNQPGGEPLVRGILASSASRALRRKLLLDPKFLRITVTDERGATIAASHKTLDYFQADEEYWQNIHAEDRGAISLTDILYDEASKSNYVGIGVPVVADDTAEFLGTLDALIEVTSLFPALKRTQIGPTGRVMLVKGDGTIISTSEGRGLSMDVRSPEFAAVVDEVPAFRGSPANYLVADLSREGDTLIGYADTGLKEDYRSLDWAVLVAQRSTEALTELQAPQQVLLLLAFLGLGAVVLLFVYFSLSPKESVEERIEPYSYGGASPLRD